jgi:hypothetical protein
MFIIMSSNLAVQLLQNSNFEQGVPTQDIVEISFDSFAFKNRIISATSEEQKKWGNSVFLNFWLRKSHTNFLLQNQQFHFSYTLDLKSSKYCSLLCCIISI